MLQQSIFVLVWHKPPGDGSTYEGSEAYFPIIGMWLFGIFGLYIGRKIHKSILENAEFKVPIRAKGTQFTVASKPEGVDCAQEIISKFYDLPHAHSGNKYKSRNSWIERKLPKSFEVKSDGDEYKLIFKKDKYDTYSVYFRVRPTDILLERITEQKN